MKAADNQRTWLYTTLLFVAGIVASVAAIHVFQFHINIGHSILPQVEPSQLVLELLFAPFAG